MKKKRNLYACASYTEVFVTRIPRNESTYLSITTNCNQNISKNDDILIDKIEKSNTYFDTLEQKLPMKVSLHYVAAV